MKILCVFGQHQYGDVRRGESTEAFSFIPALHALGHDVRLFDSWNKSLYRDFADLNSSLVDLCRQNTPDVILWVALTVEIWLETLDYLRSELGIRIIHWAPDDSWKFSQHSRFVAPHVDLCVTTYAELLPEYRKIEAAAVASGWAIPEFWKGEVIPANECRYDVSFVGTAQPVREAMVAALLAQGIEVACFGHGWPAGAVAPESIPEIFRQSRISLNFSNSTGTNQVKARVFEVTGAGGFLLTQSAAGLEAVFELGREVAVFTDMEDCAGQIRHYLSSPSVRDQMARAGNNRTLTEYTYVERLRQVLAALPSRPLLPATGAAAGADFEAVVRRHTKPYLLRLLARGLMAVGRFVFGPRRGPRFARRLCFELSWRLAGASTYRSAGFVGRMFYEQ